MALQQSACVLTVTILLLCTGCRSALTCGQAPINTRIVGGQTATPGDWPWQVSLVSGGRHRCGGSLINNQWVMTAAHCITGSGSGVTVYLGRSTQSGPNPNEVSRTIAQAKCHPSYDTVTNENDICLLKLSSPVSFTNYIQPVCLADADSILQSGVSTWVAGWGNTRPSGASASNTLQEANLDIVGNKECQRNSKFVITDKMICAWVRAGGIDSCQGDSGGGLVTKVGSGWAAVGIVSFGDGCAKPNVPGIYTRVSEYMEWISIITGSDELGFVNASSTRVDKDANFTSSTTAPPITSSTQTVLTNPTRPSTTPVIVTYPSTTPVSVTYPSTTPVSVTHPSTTPVSVTHPSTASVIVTHPSTTPVSVTHPSTTPVSVTHPSTTPLSVTHPSTTPVSVTHLSTASVIVTHPSTMPVTITHPSTTPVTITHPSTTPVTITHPSTMPVNFTHPSTTPVNFTRPPTTDHLTTDDKSIFCGSENLIHFTHFTSLWVLALSLYVLVGHA